MTDYAVRWPLGQYSVQGLRLVACLWYVPLMRASVVLGTRPEAIKLAPVIHELRRRGHEVAILLTHQQPDDMVVPVLRLFGILDPCAVGRTVGEEREGRLALIFADLLSVVEAGLRGAGPMADCVVVQGDTATALAGALVGYYVGIPVVHVEAGLRSGRLDCPWPEEGNRRMIAQAARLHCCPTEQAVRNVAALCSEGDRRAVWTQNTVVDALEDMRKYRPETLRTSVRPGLPIFKNILVTFHRRESFARVQGVARAVRRFVVDVLRPSTERREESDRWWQVTWVLHTQPEVRKAVQDELAGVPYVWLNPPFSYSEFLWHLKTAEFVLTDSGGVVEEAPSFGVPVLIAREATERLEAVEAGFAKLIGVGEEAVYDALRATLSDPGWKAGLRGRPNPFGDGRAAVRVVDAMEEMLCAP